MRERKGKNLNRRQKERERERAGENREILYVDPNKAESAREEVEEKIRGKRKPAWGRLEEGGRVVNTGWRGSKEESRENHLT